MFTGIIKEVGKVISFQRRGSTAVIRVESFDVIKELGRGDSVSVNGVCLTVTDLGSHWFSADVSSETLHKTNLGRARPGMLVNLEPSLKVGDPLGGHFVTGHVDGCGRVVSLVPRRREAVLRIIPPPHVKKYIVEKGSIAVNGVSLTVAKLTTSWFEVVLIPETLKMTNLRFLKPGEPVNLEADMLIKGIKRSLEEGADARGR